MTAFFSGGTITLQVLIQVHWSMMEYPRICTTGLHAATPITFKAWSPIPMTAKDEWSSTILWGGWWKVVREFWGTRPSCLQRFGNHLYWRIDRCYRLLPLLFWRWCRRQGIWWKPNTSLSRAACIFLSACLWTVGQNHQVASVYAYQETRSSDPFACIHAAAYSDWKLKGEQWEVHRTGVGLSCPYSRLWSALLQPKASQFSGASEATHFNAKRLL